MDFHIVAWENHWESMKIMKKSLKMGSDFMNCEHITNVINEYLKDKDTLDNVRQKMRWGYPDIAGIQAFCFNKMEWPDEYTLEKALQLYINQIMVLSTL